MRVRVCVCMCVCVCGSHFLVKRVAGFSFWWSWACCAAFCLIVSVCHAIWYHTMQYCVMRHHVMRYSSVAEGTWMHRLSWSCPPPPPHTHTRAHTHTRRHQAGRHGAGLRPVRASVPEADHVRHTKLLGAGAPQQCQAGIRAGSRYLVGRGVCMYVVEGVVMYVVWGGRV